MSDSSNNEPQSTDLSPEEARMLIKAIEEIEKEEVAEKIRSRQNPSPDSE